MSCCLAWPCRGPNSAVLLLCTSDCKRGRNAMLLDMTRGVVIQVPCMVLHISMHDFVALSGDPMLPEMPCMVLHPALSLPSAPWHAGS